MKEIKIVFTKKCIKKVKKNLHILSNLSHENTRAGNKFRD